MPPWSSPPPLLLAAIQAEAPSTDGIAFTDLDQRMTVPVTIARPGGGDPVETGP